MFINGYSTYYPYKITECIHICHVHVHIHIHIQADYIRLYCTGWQDRSHLECLQFSTPPNWSTPPLRPAPSTSSGASALPVGFAPPPPFLSASPPSPAPFAFALPRIAVSVPRTAAAPLPSSDRPRFLSAPLRSPHITSRCGWPEK